MKQFTTLLGILWRATILFPLAAGFLALVLASLIIPPTYFLCLAIFVTNWAWFGLAAWAVCVYLARKPLGQYFSHRDSDGYL
jgi:hypothetical protein